MEKKPNCYTYFSIEFGKKTYVSFFFKDEVTGENVFVPGKMIDGKNGPRFWPGQVIESEDGDEKFIPGQVINDKFVPGIIVDKVFIPGQVLRTDNGKLFLQYWFHEKKVP